MPSIIGSIPDEEVAPLVKYITKIRETLPDIDYNEALMCLLIAAYEHEL